ncbi:NAD+ synthase [Saccharicrinis fermentans]|uniref:Glutamine-dependent NAD(+) synthetase n=1 Tax=Saccharicrinis fermentans DSM 9555 = JCM 21142 TaxID=869213 RepID=W7YDL4_9BACT|nr:NAD+ synthase [Saccharicrinis fermentans]GAF02561.1 glutamine-dependent NAD(+) synthetase [Saccharicrinis fermentans DSM 9555 = JCM 21142]
MKIALAQLNYHVGNFESNTTKIIEAIENAQNDRCDLIVFSELAICGYPPLDLLEREEFVEQCLQQVNLIAQKCKSITAIVGGPSINPEPQGKNLYNSAFVLNEGVIKSIHHKTLLPNYDVFDEYRYFQPNKTFSLVKVKDKKIALTICEDLWDEQPVANSFAKSKLYTQSPMKELKQLDPDFVVNIAASPFSYNQGQIRQQIIRGKAAKNKIPFIYVNQIGANTELVFDGSSLVVNSQGKIVNQLNSFQEDIQYCQLEDIEQANIIEPSPNEKLNMIHDALVLGVKDYFGKMGFKKATLGLSGGIDSAVTLVIAVRALGAENVRVLLLPSKYSSDHSIKDAEDLANNLGIEQNIVPIKDIVDSFESTLAPLFEGLKPDVTEENIQARVRGTVLMALSNKFGHILLNTSNKSEAAVGYGTLYGDMNGGLSVLGDIYKTDVFALARYINRNEEIIPENTIVKPPSAELRPDQKDSDSLPDYDVLDQVLFNYIEKNESPAKIIAAGFDQNIVNKAVRMVNINEYKRFQTAPIIRVSSKAFGLGRRIPLVSSIQLQR